MSGLSYNYVIRQHQAAVEFYIDRGKESGQQNRQLLERLGKHREEIERTFGAELEWDSAEGRRSCRIRYAVSERGYRDQETWNDIQEQMVDAMVRLERSCVRFPIRTPLQVTSSEDK